MNRNDSNCEQSELEARAAMFKALGEPTRLRIFDLLRNCAGTEPLNVCDCGEVSRMTGPTAGEICCRVTGSERITSTISEHLKELRTAGLISMERSGKHMICRVNPDALRILAEYFQNDAERSCQSVKGNENDGE